MGERLRAGADPNRKDPRGYPPLCLAAGPGNAPIVEQLLLAGADPLLLDSRMGASALHKAAQSGVVEVARLLLEHGAFVDQQAPTHGHTPLIDAVWHKRPAMVEFLLDAGANPMIAAHGGYTPGAMEWTFADDDFTPFRELIQRAVAGRAERDADELRHAALNGDAVRVAERLASGADIDRKAPDGHTPLLDAAREGHTEVVNVLLRNGADPRIVDHLMKATPGHKAGAMGRAEVARLLVEDDRLDIDAQGPYNGYTALHDAVWHGHLEVAWAFLDAGARTDLCGHDGRTPLDMAREYGYPEIVALLESHAGRRAAEP